ncbi:hypothetical protein QTP70_017711, partial [Hemibagrus guttatus]
MQTPHTHGGGRNRTPNPAVDVLEAGKMDKCKDLTKGQIVMARPLDLQNCSSCGVFPVCS